MGFFHVHDSSRPCGKSDCADSSAAFGAVDSSMTHISGHHRLQMLLWRTQWSTGPSCSRSCTACRSNSWPKRITVVGIASRNVWIGSSRRASALDGAAPRCTPLAVRRTFPVQRANVETNFFAFGIDILDSRRRAGEEGGKPAPAEDGEPEIGQRHPRRLLGRCQCGSSPLSSLLFASPTRSLSIFR